MLKQLSVLALAGFAFAQQNDTVPDLAAALNSTDQLSTLKGVIPAGVLESLSGLTNITILAPSNDAFAQIDNETLSGLAANEGLLTALLQYHVLNGTYLASAITNSSVFVPTALTNNLFTNVTGGQVVEAMTMDSNVVFYSGLLANSTVTTAVSSSRSTYKPTRLTHPRMYPSPEVSSTLLTACWSSPKPLQTPSPLQASPPSAVPSTQPTFSTL
jgi:hypothetical protein